MIEMNDVRAFEKVARLLSFSAAGRVLGVRKSAVSRSIQRLETALHVRLFERTTREVALTEAGRAVLPGFSDMLQRMDAVVDLAGSLSAQPRGRLKLTAGIGFGTEVLSELLPAFSAAYPDIAVAVDLTSRQVDLVAEHVDAAFRMGPLADSSLIAIRLGAIGCVVCASPDYLRRRGEPRTVEDLSEHDLLAMPRPDGLARQWVFQDRSGNRRVVDQTQRLSANDTISIHRMAVNGAGIAALASYKARPDIENGQLVEVLKDWTVPAVDVSLVMPGGRERSPATKAFVAFIRERAIGNPAWFGGS